MAFVRISHVGVAVSSLAQGSSLWDRLGIPQTHQEDVSQAQTRVSFHPIGESNIELLEGMGDDSAVARFVDKRGPGIHHICFEVDDIEAEMNRLKGEGFRFLTEKPTLGAHDTLVAFLHPKDTGGVLIELNKVMAQ